MWRSDINAAPNLVHLFLLLFLHVGQNIQLAEGKSRFLVQWIQAWQNCKSPYMNFLIFPLFFLFLPCKHSHPVKTLLVSHAMTLRPTSCFSSLNSTPLLFLFYTCCFLSSLAFLLPVELRGCRGQNHHHGADDLPQAPELSRAAELHLYLPSVGGVVRRQGWQLRQGAALPGLQRRGAVVRQ